MRRASKKTGIIIKFVISILFFFTIYFVVVHPFERNTFFFAIGRTLKIMSHFFVSSRVEEMDKNMTALFIIDPFFLINRLFCTPSFQWKSWFVRFHSNVFAREREMWRKERKSTIERKNKTLEIKRWAGFFFVCYCACAVCGYVISSIDFLSSRNIKVNSKNNWFDFTDLKKNKTLFLVFFVCVFTDLKSWLGFRWWPPRSSAASVTSSPSSHWCPLKPVDNFINILWAAFEPIFFWQKITKPKCN